jgi:hypothetical protein
MKSKSNRKGENTMSSTANTSTIAAIDSKKANTKQELITANIKLLIEQLEAGKSDALTNYLTAMSRLHNYSFGNVLEIARKRAVTYCYTSLESMNIGGCASLETRDGRHGAVRTNLMDLVDRKQITHDWIRQQHQLDVVTLSVLMAVTDVTERVCLLVTPEDPA